MQPLLSHASAGLASIAIGFATARVIQSSPLHHDIAVPPPLAKSASPAPGASTDDSPAASQQRIRTVLTLGEKHRDLADDHALYEALHQLNAPDLLAGADEFAALLKREDYGWEGPAPDLAEAWIERWLEVDAPGALRWLASSKMLDEANRRELRSADGVPMSVFSVLARRQPDWLHEYVASLKPEATRDLGIYALLSERARHDAAGARRLLAEYVDGPNRPAAVQGCVAGLVRSDYRAAFELADAEPAGPSRRTLLRSLFSEAASRGIGAVSELISQIDDPSERREMAGQALGGMSRKSRENPLPWIKEEAEEFPSTVATSQSEDMWRSGVALVALENAPAPAADWAATLASDPEKKMLSAILHQWAFQDAGGCRNWLAGHASEVNAAIVEKLAYHLSTMARSEKEDLRAWTATLPPGILRDRAQFELALAAGAEGDFAQATSAYEAVAAGDAGGERLKQLGTVIAKRDGAAAAEWAFSMPAGPARISAVNAVAAEWSASDPRGTAEWLEQMPAGSERDAAVREYAAKVVYADPATAAEWVAQVADPAVRADAAARVFDIWNRENPVAARAWRRALKEAE